MKDWSPAMHTQFKQIQTDQKLPAYTSIQNILAIEKKKRQPTNTTTLERLSPKQELQADIKS